MEEGPQKREDIAEHQGKAGRLESALAQKQDTAGI